MHKSRRVKITDLNPHIICVLCSGYLIEATTIIECLHSFCRTCLVKYLEHNKYCPICEVQVHKTKPLLNIRSDQTLQDIVYKLVPGLFQNEMCRRKDFYLKHPDQKPPDLEGRGEITQFSHIYTPDESISLSLEYYNNNHENDNKIMETKKMQEPGSRRYLRCPAAVSVAHLQKLIRAKYGLCNEHRVDILYKNDRLSEDFTLMDIAYIYLWRRKGPLHLTYRIFEVAKRIKLNDTVGGNEEIKTELLESDDTKVKNEWKEVQLQISENGVMSVTNIGETTKTPETVTNFEVNLQKTCSKHVEPKVEKSENTENTDAEKTKTSELGKHKLQQDDATIEKSAKMMKPNNMANSKTSLPAKNVQQLSRNHPLKIHSQSVNKNNIPVTKIQLNSILNVKTTQLKNQNTHVQSLSKTSVTKVVVTQEAAPATVQNIVTTQVQSTPNAKAIQNNPTPIVILASLGSTVNSSSSISSLTGQNTLKYTQAGQSNCDNTRVTKSDDSIQNNNNQKTPISSSSVVSANNCIQSSKVGIVPKKSPVKIGSPLIYKTLRDPPKAWNPQIPRQHLTKTTVHQSNNNNNNNNNNNGASTSDQKQRAVETPSKPAKFFKMRNNVPRYLGNPASGVKPMYQVRDGDKTVLDANKKQPETKLNNNNDINKTNKPQTQALPPPPQPPQSQEIELKAKIEIKKQTIVKIDPKTLRPILDKPIVQDMASPSTSCADAAAPEIKINQSSVPIFNPLRNQKSQTSPKVDRRSPKTSTVASSYMDPSPKNCGKMTAATCATSKKDKLSLNFTPPNPFIPNLASPNLAPNQFLYPNFPSYDPRVMNNLTAYHPFSMYYSQPRLTYPGLSSQNLPLPPNLMSTLNLEVNKNLRKNYEMLQLNMENKKLITATCVKNDEINNEKAENAEKSQEINNKNTKIPTKQTDQKQIVSNNGNNKDESRIKANEISNQLQKSNKEKEINAVCKSQAKEIPTETKEKEKTEVKVKVKDAKIEPPIKNIDKKDSKVELKNNEIVQKPNSEMKNVHVNDKKTEAVKTT